VGKREGGGLHSCKKAKNTQAGGNTSRQKSGKSQGFISKREKELPKEPQALPTHSDKKKDFLSSMDKLEWGQKK